MRIEKYLCIGLLFILPLSTHAQKKRHRSQSALTFFEERRILIKRGCKIVIHSLELVSGLSNFLVCGYLIGCNPWKDQSCEEQQPSFTEKCLGFTKLSIVGPALTIGGIMGLYEDLNTPLIPPHENPTLQHLH